MKVLAISLSTLFLTASFASGQDFMAEAAAIRLSYSNTPDRKLDGLSTEVGISQWAVMSPIFYHKGEGWSFGTGFRYESTNLDFSDILTLDEDHLHSIDLPLFLSKEQSERIEWMLLFNPTLAGDYEQVDGDAFNYLALGGARYKKSATFEWFFGAVYTTGFDDDLFLPVIGFHWKPSEQSDFFFAGPIIRYRYSFNDSIDLILAGNLTGNRWNTEAGYGERNFRLRSYRLSLALQWNLTEKQALFAAMGTEFAREVEINNAGGTTLLKKDLGSAPHFEIGYRFRF
jgi:hypothetical protein